MELWGKICDFFTRNNMVAENLISTVFLIGIEEMLEDEYKCPSSSGCRIALVCCYFVIPVVLLLTLSVYFHVWVFKSWNGTCLHKCWIVYQSVIPSFTWFVILLLDGRYIECAVPSDDASSPALSKIAGICSLFLFVFLSICISCKCKSSPGKLEKWELEGVVTWSTAEGPSGGGNRNGFPSQCLVTKSPTSTGTNSGGKGKKTKNYSEASMEMTNIRPCSEELKKWEVKGDVTCSTAAEGSGGGGNRKLSFHCFVNKSPTSTGIDRGHGIQSTNTRPCSEEPEKWEVKGDVTCSTATEGSGGGNREAENQKNMVKDKNPEERKWIVKGNAFVQDPDGGNKRKLSFDCALTKSLISTGTDGGSGEGDNLLGATSNNPSTADNPGLNLGTGTPRE